MEWAIFDWLTGHVLRVKPATEETAVAEAKLANLDKESEEYTAFPLDFCYHLNNAFSHGRMYGYRQAERA